MDIDTFTAPSGPSSINDEIDAQESSEACLPALKEFLDDYDGFVVACYSVHPLVNLLRKEAARHDHSKHYRPIVGIFEASISAALSLLSIPSISEDPSQATQVEKFGIVSTGKYWEDALTHGVLSLLGHQSKDAPGSRFKGVETTGLSAEQLHTAPPEEVRQKMMDATKRLVKDGDVTVICLGCAGMAGMDEMVLEACVEALGREKAKSIRIVDGVKAAVGMVDSLIRAQRGQEFP